MRTKQKSKVNGMNSLAVVKHEAAASSVVVTDDEADAVSNGRFYIVDF